MFAERIGIPDAAPILLQRARRARAGTASASRPARRRGTRGCRETASRMICPKIGARTSSTSPTAKMIASTPPPLRSPPRRPRTPPHHHDRMKNSLNQDDRADERRDDRAEQDVAVDDVRDLVPDHALELDPVHRRRAAPASRRPTSAPGRGRSRTRSAPARGRRRPSAWGSPAAIDRPSTMLCRRGCSSGVTSRARVEARTRRSPPKYDAERQDDRERDRDATRPAGAASRTRARATYPTAPSSTIDADDEQDGLALVRRDLLVHGLPRELDLRRARAPGPRSRRTPAVRTRTPRRRRSRGTSWISVFSSITWSL